MLDEQTPVPTGTEDTSGPTDAPPPSGDTATPPPAKRAARKTAARRPAGPATPSPDPAPVTAPEAVSDAVSGPESAADGGTPVDAGPPADGPTPPARKRAPRKTATKKTAAPAETAPAETAPAGSDPVPAAPADADSGSLPPVGGDTAPAKKTARRRTTKKVAAGPAGGPDATSGTDSVTEAATGTAADPAVRSDTEAGSDDPVPASAKAAPPATMLLFQPPDPTAARPVRKRAAKKTSAPRPVEVEGAPESEDAETESVEESSTAVVPDDEQRPAGSGGGTEDDQDGAVEQEDESDEGEGGARRRRRRGGRRRRKGGEGDSGTDTDEPATSDGGRTDQDDRGGSTDQSPETHGDHGPEQDSDGDGGTTRRRRRRRRSGDGDDIGSDDPENTVVRVRQPRSAEDEITTFSGSTRLEAKKQRRREGREAGRRRAPIISEAEFLARREAVERQMVIRQKGDLTQIAVLEDKVLVEHYVARDSQTSLIGNVYLGRVQNVLPSMEAAFIDIGKGRNAVLYAGEVNWDALGAKDGKQRKIEQVLKPGQSILVQVSKDPIGHKGARLTSQVSLPGRFLVYVPDGTTSGISRKLPENERNRLKSLLKEIVPDTAGVIVRTAAEGASEAELTHDVERLKALWEGISGKAEGGDAPQLLYGEPDLTVKVVRDLFTEDIGQLVISGEEAWQMVEDYVSGVAPDLAGRVLRHDDSERDAFAEYRIDEQIAKALERKVWLPSGGSLVIDRTEAMTVVDVNTGKFTGSGGNLEETVTKNNLEAAEEIVRQLRLRDIGGIIVIDFIDMVLENNRDLVLRRLIECLGRDRTRHQVAEVTSLGLVQMTRKRIGTGLLEAFSESCEHCQGRGLLVRSEPVDSRRKQQGDEESQRGRRSRGRGKGVEGGPNGADGQSNGGGNGRRSGARDSSRTAEGKDAGGGSVRRPTPAEFAAMVRSESVESSPPPTTDEEWTTPEPTTQPRSHPVAEPTTQAVTQAVTQPAETTPEQVAEPQPEPEATPEPVAEPVMPVPTGPRLVTTVRRSGARRAAGPPAAQVAVTSEEQPGEPSDRQGDQQGDQQGDRGEALTDAAELTSQPQAP